MFVVPKTKNSALAYTLKTVKHGGGKVIVWGSCSWCGVGPLHRIQGTIDQHMYKEILENVMLPYAEENLPLVWKFQEDNDPKHTTKSVKMWFNAKKINVLEWPAQSPDINPIENLWEKVDRNIKMPLFCTSKSFIRLYFFFNEVTLFSYSVMLSSKNSILFG